MYEHEGLNDILFLMLYGGAALLAVVACLYLLLYLSLKRMKGATFSTAFQRVCPSS